MNLEKKQENRTLLPNFLFRNLSLTAVVFSLIVSGVFFACGSWMAGLGVWVGAAWTFLNSYFLFRLIQIGFQPKVHAKDGILLFSILKFPVLYIVGFFILKTHVFPINGIVTGLAIFLAVFFASLSYSRFFSKTSLTASISESSSGGQAI